MTVSELIGQLSRLPDYAMVSVWAQDKVFGVEGCVANTVRIGGVTNTCTVRIVTEPLFMLQDDDTDK